MPQRRPCRAFPRPQPRRDPTRVPATRTRTPILRRRRSTSLPDGPHRGIRRSLDPGRTGRTGMTATTSAAITTRGLIKRYGSTTALHGIDLDIPRGSVFGMIGPNGAGKTTTMRLLLDIIRPSGGELRVLGELPRT